MTDKGTHSFLLDTRNENIQVFINGGLYPRDKASISVFDSGFLLGDGVWEGIRLLNGLLIFLEEHLERLYDGAEKLAIDIGHTKEELTRLIHKTLDANDMETGVHIRLIVSRGLKKTPLDTNLHFCRSGIFGSLDFESIIFDFESLFLISTLV